MSTITMPQKSNSEVDALKVDEDVSIGDIAVWIDPLDATQEYTGNSTTIVKLPVHNYLWCFQLFSYRY